MKMFFIHTITFLVFLIINSFCFSQDKIDSLLALLKKDKVDTNKINHLNFLGKELMPYNRDTSILLTKQALLLSENSKWKKGIAMSFGNLGNYNYLKAEYAIALEYYLKALKIDEELKNKNGIATRLGNIGIIYLEKGEYSKSLNYFLEALKIDEELGDKKGTARHLSSAGIVCLNQGDYVRSLGYFLKSLKLSEQLKNKIGIAIALGNIANIYNEQGDFKTALDYDLKALKLAEETGDKNGIARHLGNIGGVYDGQVKQEKSKVKIEELTKLAIDYYFRALKVCEEIGDINNAAIWQGNIGGIYHEQKNYSKAIDYYLKALKTAEELGDINRVAVWLGNIGAVFIEQKNYLGAFAYIYRGLALSDSIGALNDVKEMNAMLSVLYEKSNIKLCDSVGGKLLNMEQMRLRALYYHKRYISIRDTLFSEENKKQLVRKEMNFEFEKKESATKAEQEKKDAVAASDAKRQKIVLVLVSFVLLLVAVVAFIVLRSLKITRRQKALIEEQKNLVEEKQKEILDSIYYARRIQRSLLPTEKYIARLLARHRE